MIYEKDEMKKRGGGRPTGVPSALLQYKVNRCNLGDAGLKLPL